MGDAGLACNRLYRIPRRSTFNIKLGKVKPMPEDAVRVAPDAAKVLFENDRIRVLEIKLKKRQKMAMHSHPANLVYSLTSGKMKSTSSDGKVETMKMKKGRVGWSDGGSHAVENVGDSASATLVIEMK